MKIIMIFFCVEKHDAKIAKQLFKESSRCSKHTKHNFHFSNRNTSTERKKKKRNLATDCNSNQERERGKKRESFGCCPRAWFLQTCCLKLNLQSVQWASVSGNQLSKRQTNEIMSRSSKECSKPVRTFARRYGNVNCDLLQIISIRIFFFVRLCQK